MKWELTEEKELFELKQHLNDLYQECEDLTEDTDVEVVQYLENRINEITEEIRLLSFIVEQRRNEEKRQTS